MKKFLFLIISAVLVVSCDLTKMPDGSISTENALTSVDDVLKFRADIYLSLRDGLCSEYPIYIPELMTDSFHASITFGNRNGEKYLINDSPEVLEKFASLYKASYKDNKEKAEKIAKAVLSETSWWGEDLTAVAGLEAVVAKHLENIWTNGMTKAIESL